MPGDLKDQQNNSFFYDSRFEPGSSVFNSVPLAVDQILKTYSFSILGRPLSVDEKNDITGYLEQDKMLQRNPGDQEVQEKIKGYLNNIKSQIARKVCAKWLQLTIIR
jgi:hypothetical protein